MRARLLALALVVGLALGLGAPTALAGSTPVEPVPPATQYRADVTADWLAATLHADVPRVAFHVLTQDERDMVERAGLMPGASVGGLNYRNLGGALDRGVADDVTRFHKDWEGGTGFTILTHELLHSDRDLQRRDEGIVEALTQDVVPAAYRAATGRHIGRAGPAYADLVANVRGASAIATGSTTWRSYEARQWRRKLWAASPEQRSVMLADADTRRSQ